MLGLRQTAGFDVPAAARELELSFLPNGFHVHNSSRPAWIEFDGTILKLTPKGGLSQVP